MLKRSENIFHRIFNRQISNVASNTQINRVRQFYENIVPSHTVYDVEYSDILFRKFTTDGQYLICFRQNYFLVIYRLKWLNYCLKGDLSDIQDELPSKANKFESYFTELYSIRLGSGNELICKDFFLSTENNTYGIFATATGRVDASATNGAVPGVPSIERITMHLVRLADGTILDERVYHNDFIHLAHNMGVFMYEDLLAILSVRFQSIYILQVRESGKFVDVRTIGTFCREDDELLINSHLQKEEMFQSEQVSLQKGKCTEALPNHWDMDQSPNAMDCLESCDRNHGVPRIDDEATMGLGRAEISDGADQSSGSLRWRTRDGTLARSVPPDVTFNPVGSERYDDGETSYPADRPIENSLHHNTFARRREISLGGEAWWPQLVSTVAVGSENEERINHHMNNNKFNGVAQTGISGRSIISEGRMRGQRPVEYVISSRQPPALRQVEFAVNGVRSIEHASTSHSNINISEESTRRLYTALQQRDSSLSAGNFGNPLENGHGRPRSTETISGASAAVEPSEGRLSQPDGIGKLLGGIKQRLLSFKFQSIWNQEQDPISKAQQLKRFYYQFQQYADLIMLKVQFLDRHHLLIRFGSTEGSRNTDVQTSFFVVYNFETTEILEFEQNSSEEFLRFYENFCDFFRVPQQSMRYITSYSNNVFLRDQLRKQRLAKIYNHAQVIRRTLAILPFNAQSQNPSAYFDQSLFNFDEKIVSSLERHITSIENPIKFTSRRRPNVLKFKIKPGLEHANDGRTKKVAFLFHPIFPFVISIQQSYYMQPPIVNFHFRK